jgi:hypothetical protein
MQMPIPKARFLINPLVVESIWTPEPYQLFVWPNPSRLNSIWLGTVAQLVMLPGRIWTEFVMPLFLGYFFLAFWYGFWFIPTSTMKWLCAGLKGNLFAVRLPLEVAVQAELMTNEVALKFLCMGVEEPVIDMERKTAHAPI